MKWTLKLGTVAGTQLYLHWTFLLLLGWVFFVTWGAGGGVATAMAAAGFLAAISGCVLLHELGHVLAARGYGIATHDITLLPIGGLARLERMPEKPAQEFWVALAGPAVNVAIAAILFLIALPSARLDAVGYLADAGGSFLVRLIWVNIFLVGFNLLPAFPMDGGRVLRALLAMRMGRRKATRIAASVGQGMAMLFVVVGLLYNPLLIVIALFVFLGAAAEAQDVEVDAAIHDLTVSDAMVTGFRTLRADDSLDTAAHELLAGAQEDFPVVSEGHIVGVLRRQDLATGLAQSGPDGRVADAVCGECRSINADDPLEQAVVRIRQGQCAALPVMRGEKLVVLLTHEKISDLILVHSARQGKRRCHATAAGMAH